jgi:hypothetical protein
LFDPPFYVPFVLHYVVLAGIGLFANERGYQLFLAGSILFSGLFWALVVRRLLGG